MTEDDALAMLKAAGVPDPRGDIRRLAGADFAAHVIRRASYEPISHILGRRAFWKHDFQVTSDVLDPRPDTETLVETALAEPFTRVLDLGTGSGCILCSLLADRMGAQGTGTDISSAALNIARQNADHIGVQAHFIQSNWFENIQENVQGSYDLIVSNPPYIDADSYETLDKTVRDYEPKIALTPGGDGLDAYRIITAQAPDYLTPQGRLIVEIGFDQADPVQALFAQAGLDQVTLTRDINGKARVISGRKPS